MTMTMKLLAAAAVLALAAGSAYAADPNYGATSEPAPQQQPAGGATQTDPNGGPTVYQPSIAANPGETAHVIGGQTFYYSGDAANSVSGDGSAD
jgi:hypothetical protein